MKFMYFFLPTLPATMEERRRLRPIANDPDRWQRMIEEVVEVSQLAEEVGFDAVCFPEHHLHSEGIEMGSLPVLTQHVIHNTKRIKVGPVGYVLPGWNPLRLALEIAERDEQREIDVVMASSLDPVVEQALHPLPDTVTPRLDHHAAAHARFFGHVGCGDHVLVPGGEIVGAARVQRMADIGHKTSFKLLALRGRSRCLIT